MASPINSIFCQQFSIFVSKLSFLKQKKIQKVGYTHRHNSVWHTKIHLDTGSHTQSPLISALLMAQQMTLGCSAAINRKKKKEEKNEREKSHLFSLLPSQCLCSPPQRLWLRSWRMESEGQNQRRQRDTKWEEGDNKHRAYQCHTLFRESHCSRVLFLDRCEPVKPKSVSFVHAAHHLLLRQFY